MATLIWYLILIYFVGAIVCAFWCSWKATSSGYRFGVSDCLLWPLFIASLCSLKSVFTGEVKEASTKATVRFKNGAAVNLYTPSHASDEMKIAVSGFVAVNRDLEKEARFRERAMNAHPLTQIRMHNNQCGNFSQITMNDIMGTTGRFI